MAMRIAGIALLAVGVGLSAAYGARLGDSMSQGVQDGGNVHFAQSSFGSYCKARAEADLTIADDCPLPPYCTARAQKELPRIEACPLRLHCEAREAAELSESSECRDLPEEEEEDEPEATASEPEDPPTYDEVVAAGRARLTAARSFEESLPDELREQRNAWLEALEASIEPGARAATSTPPDPGLRTSEWFGGSGMPFLLGLLLVVVGAVLSRIAVKKAALAAGDAKKGADEDAPATDFGETLEQLRDEVKALAESMEDEGSPEDHERVKNALDTLHYEKFEPLVEARVRVQTKYGMGGFAELFGPLSAGERAANRAWAALVDDHWPEAKVSVERSARELGRAHDKLRELMKSG